MEYNDFCLSENFEKMAAEYSKTLQNKGFVFVRLEPSQSKIKNLASFVLEKLSNQKDILNRAKRYNQSLLNDLNNLTAVQIQSLAKLYSIAIPQTQTAKNYRLETIITTEASVLKGLFDLFEEEDDGEKHVLLKNMLTQRFDTLSNKHITKY